MVSDMTQNSNKKRGIIIVDSSALFKLCLPVDHVHLIRKPISDEKPVYADVLRFLGNHGYEIIIPEMVAYQCSQVLHDGLKYNNGIPNSRGCKPHTLDAYLADLFADIASGRFPGAKIVAPQPHDNSGAASFMRKIWHASRQQREGRDATAERKAVMELANLHKETNTKGYNTQAAIDLVKSMKDLREPIFYLSDNAHSLQEVYSAGTNGKVGKLNLRGLIVAMDRAKLLGCVNINSVDGTMPLVDDMLQQHAYLSRSHNQELKISSAIIPILDSNYANGESNYPFLESLKGIRREVEEARSAEKRLDQEISRKAPAQNPASRFTEKFKGRYNFGGNNIPRSDQANTSKAEKFRNGDNNNYNKGGFSIS